MALTYHAGRRIQGLSTEKPTDTPYDKHAGTTFVGLNGTGVQGFGNKVFSGFELIGTTITKIGFYMKTAGSGTIQFGIWNSSSGLKLEFGTKSASTLTSTETLYEFENLTGVILEVGDYIGWRLASGDSSPTCSRYNDGTGASPYLYGSYIGSSAIWQDAGDHQDMNMKLTPKALNIQIGSRFEETDTRKIYFFKDPLVFEDDFSSYADQASADAVWARSSINNIVNVSTDKIDFNFKRGTNARISKDLGVGNISNTAWVLRMKLRFSALSGNNKVMTISLNTTDYNTAKNGTQNELGCVICSGASQNGLNGSSGNGAVSGSYIGTFAINTDYYLEIKRLSATTASAQIFSDSGYTTLTHNTGIFVISSAITGLRYLKILDDNTFDVYDDTGLGTIDDIKFYNGVTTIGNYWTEES